jgi:hypothetical protein
LQRGPQTGESQKKLIGKLEIAHRVGWTFHQGRNRDRGLLAGDDHDGATVHARRLGVRHRDH